MRLLPVVLLLTGIIWSCASWAQSLRHDEILSSVSVRPISAANPVTGADGRIHLAYELMVDNPSRLFVTLDKVEAVDAEGRTLWAREGDALAAMTTLYAGQERQLPPGGSAAVFMDVSFGPDERLPESILARVTVTRQLAGADGKPAPFPSSEPLPATVTFTGAPTAIGAPARVVEPPLRGKGWVAANGCCDSITSHRGAIMAVNGLLRVPERFAIDFVQIDGSGRLFSGEVSSLASYPYYGAPVHAVADGVVVNLYDEADEQVPGKIEGITTENIGGNMLVVDIGDGAYAFYAHMQRDSLKVKLGDSVTSGQVIGLLGNTGNTTAPHLHFHLMDGPSPLDANGLPYAFTRFSSRGVMAIADGPEPFDTGDPITIDAGRLAGEHRDQLPLNNQIVDFD